jgi:hypothetical protein
MYQQLWVYRVEEKLYLGVREQKRLNATVLRNKKVRFGVLCNQPLVHILSHVNYATYSLRFFKIIFNIIIPSTSRSSKCPFPRQFFLLKIANTFEPSYVTMQKLKEWCDFE